MDKMATGRKHPHPLAPLSGSEISVTREVILRSRGPETVMFFRSIQLQEPRKSELTPYLVAEHADAVTDETARPARLARAQYQAKRGEEAWFFETVVDVVKGEEVSSRKFSPDFPIALNVMDILGMQEACQASPLMKEALAEFKMPEGFTLAAEPWPYGGPDLDSDTTRYVQALLFARDASSGNAHSNHYAYPIPLVAVFDAVKREIIRVDRCATGGYGDPLHPPPRAEEPRELFSRSKPAEYMPELLGWPLRADLKPLDVTQPEGPSFTVSDGNLVEWQKWRFRVGFTGREGAVLHDVTYDHRPILYRLSMSEMTVPYADARPPFHHKQAFDFGDGGVGLSANNLQLGCDCLGRIHYFGAVTAMPDGRPAEAANRVCMHEQDNGILWKHSSLRGLEPAAQRAVVVRLRELVVQFVCTLGNYEYIFAYKLDQAGGICVETRATGVVSVAAIDYGKKSPYGTVVQDGVLAQNHQHMIAMRIDPAIDSYEPGATGVLVEESRPLPLNPDTNPFGNAYEVVRTPVSRAGWLDAEPRLNRVVRLVNWDKTNAASGKNVAYRFTPPATQLLLADPRSRAARRARFATHHVWVTGYRDDELWAAGEFTNLSKDEVGGVADMVARGDWFVEGEEKDAGGGSGGERSSPIIWSVFGLTHNPRVEDWPVMPAEIHTIHFKPADFFDANPALDVPSNKNVSSALASAQTCCAHDTSAATSIGQDMGQGGGPSSPPALPPMPTFPGNHWQGGRDIDPRSIGRGEEEEEEEVAATDSSSRAGSLVTDPSDWSSVHAAASGGTTPGADQVQARAQTADGAGGRLLTGLFGRLWASAS